MQQHEIVDHKDLPEWAQRQATYTDHPIIRDEEGTLRYQPSSLMLALYRLIDLNEMARMAGRGEISLEDYMAFYRGIGFRLDMFDDKFAETFDHLDVQRGEAV